MQSTEVHFLLFHCFNNVILCEQKLLTMTQNYSNMKSCRTICMYEHKESINLQPSTLKKQLLTY